MFHKVHTVWKVFFEPLVRGERIELSREFCLSVDTSGDGSVEKSEFEQARTKDSSLNSTVIQIFEQKFQQDSATKITYEGLLSFF